MTTKSEKVKLLPCPFCGSESPKVHEGRPAYEYPSDEEWFYLKCVACGAKGSLESTDELAIKAWNQRSK